MELRWLPSPLDVARLDCTSRLFHLGTPRSATEEGLRLRAEAAGQATVAVLPAGEMSWAQWLLWQERQQMACAPPRLREQLAPACCSNIQGIAL